MPKNKSAPKTKSNTMHHHMAQSHTLSQKAPQKSINKSGFKFRWWYAAIFIIVIALVGIAVLRFSRASGEPIKIERSNMCQIYRSDPLLGWFFNDTKVCKDTYNFLDGGTGTVYHPYNGRFNTLLRKSDNTCYGFNREYTERLGLPYVNYYDVTIQEYSNTDRSNCDPVSTQSYTPANPVDETKTGTSPYPRKYGSDTEQNILVAIQHGITDIVLREFCGQYDQSGRCRNFVDANYVTPPNGLQFDNYQQQLIQIALRNGTTVAVLKKGCAGFTNVPACTAYVDEQYAYLQATGGGGPLPPPPTPPVYVPPPPNPNKGENDGRWVVYSNPRNPTPGFFTHPNFPGKCFFAGGNGFLVDQGFDCDAEIKRLVCGNYNTFIANLDLCDPNGEFRAAQDFVKEIELNRTTNPVGNVDENISNCASWKGWDASARNPSIALSTAVYIDGVEQKPPIKANKVRSDLTSSRDALASSNGGAHAFEYPIPDKFRDGKQHKIGFYALGIRKDGSLNGLNPLLGGKEFNFTCDIPPTGAIEKIEAQMEKGTFTCTVTGFAFDASSPNTPIKIDAYVDNVGVAHEILANGFKQEFITNGLSNGNHQYKFNLPGKFLDAKKHRLDVYGLGVGTNGQPNNENHIAGTKEFQCDLPPAGNAEEVIVNTAPSNPSCAIKGWSADPSYFFNNSIVAYYDPSADFKTYKFLSQPYKANLNRPDLIANGVPVGNNPNHGFIYPIDRKFFDGQTHTVYLYSLNVDRNGAYIQQNNTFIGRQIIKCPNLQASTDPVNKIATSEPTSISVSSSVTKAKDTNTNQEVTAIVTRTPLAYDQANGAAQVAKAAADSAPKNDKQIPSVIPSTAKLAETQATGDNGPELKGTVYIKPDLPADLNIDKVVIYLDGKSPTIYSSLADTVRTLDTKTLADGLHSVQILAYNGQQNVRALNQRIQTNNGGLNAIQRFYYALGNRN